MEDEPDLVVGVEGGRVRGGGRGWGRGGITEGSIVEDEPHLFVLSARVRACKAAVEGAVGRGRVRVRPNFTDLESLGMGYEGGWEDEGVYGAVFTGRCLRG